MNSKSLVIPINNKKPIFPWYDTDRRENDASDNSSIVASWFHLMANQVFSDKMSRLGIKELLVIRNDFEGMVNQGGWDGQDMLHAWERSAYRILVTKLEGNRPLGKLRRVWIIL
jgi:hypothetical protein